MEISQTINTPSSTSLLGVLRYLLGGSVLVSGVTALCMVAVFWYASGSAYNQDVVTLFLVYAFLALGMYIPVVLGGHIDLAYNAYFAIGAYSVAIVARDTEWPLLAAVPIGVAVAMLIAAVLGFITTKLSGFHLALATLAFGFAFYRWILNARGVTGGAAGIGDIPRPSLLGWELDRLPLLGLSLAVLWVLATLTSNFRGGIVGLGMRLQRETLPAAEATGISTRTLQTLSLSFGAGIACLAGVLIALINQFVLAESFTIGIVFIVLFMPLLGGMGSPWGAVLGAFVVSAINEGGALLRGPGALVFGLTTLLVIIAAPAGLLGLGASLVAAVRRRRRTPEGA
jgi:branched-chain amino acid transport system permease protein